MISENTQRNFSASVRLMKRVEASCVALQPLGELRTDEELAVRARIVRSALNARALFKNIHRRTHALNEALARFHARKGRIGTGAGVDVEALAGWLQCDRT